MTGLNHCREGLLAEVVEVVEVQHQPTSQPSGLETAMRLPRMNGGENPAPEGKAPSSTRRTSRTKSLVRLSASPTCTRLTSTCRSAGRSRSEG